ncbi:hypothetical protein ABIC32_000782 [Brevundimonas sp. 1080]|uniref:hypothetical protein n=1 Tax=Brevundimonas sp. 1080 TaxID=3156405 RepID=UPI003396A5BB
MNLEPSSTSHDVIPKSRPAHTQSIQPRMFTAQQAASYVGYKSTDILRRIPVGPVSLSQKGDAAPRWDKVALDRWLDGLGGMNSERPETDLDLEAEFAAWEAGNGH